MNTLQTTRLGAALFSLPNSAKRRLHPQLIGLAFVALVAALGSICTSSAQDAVLSNQINAFNVSSYGAKGNGTSDDTASIQSAINAAVAKGSGVVVFPPGTYLISAPLLMSNVYGIAFQGGGRTDTFILASTALAGQSMIFLTNCGYCAIRDMTIEGPNQNASAAPLCAIETHVNHPTSVTPTFLYLEHLNIGLAGYNLQWGVRWTCEPGDDVNNEMAYVFDCTGSSWTANADFYIGHSNSEVHRFVRCEFNAPTGIETHGGSVIVTNSWVGDTNWFLDFEDAQYYHVSMVSDTDSEVSSGVIKSTAGAWSCNLYVSHFGGPAGKGTGVPWIWWEAPGILSFEESYLDPSAPASPVVTGPGSDVSFSNCRLGVHNLEYGGSLTLQFNTVLYGDFHLTEDSGGMIFERGNSGPAFNDASQGWY